MGRRGRIVTWPASAPDSFEIECKKHKGVLQIDRKTNEIIVVLDTVVANALGVTSNFTTPKDFAMKALGITKEKWDKDRLGWKQKFKIDKTPLISVFKEYEQEGQEYVEVRIFYTYT
jgi:hypothetical protein